MQLSEAFARIFCDEIAEPVHDGDDDKAGEREPVIEHKHAHQNAHMVMMLARCAMMFWGHCLIDCVDVVWSAAHEPARRICVAETHGKRLDVHEQITAQILQGILRNAGHPPVRQDIEAVAQNIRG